MNLRFTPRSVTRILIALLLRVNILWLAIKCYRNPSKAIKAVRMLIKKRAAISQVQISGGEPMTRFEDLLTIIKETDKSTDTWLLTSGYNLTFQNALKLKKAGLTGVRISIDHWEAEKHNEFRGNKKAFAWAIDAAENCRKAGLATGLAICAIKEFLSDAFLMKYLEFARSLKASFIFLLEPRETGHFKNRDVILPDESVRCLENFYLKVSSSPEFEKYPALFFPGFHQRRIGCFGAGVRYLYIDSEGSVHACPFCQGKMGDSLKDDLTLLVPLISRKGCHLFPKPENVHNY